MSSKKFEVQQVASGEEVEILRHESSQSLAERSHHQNLYTKNRSGAFENSLVIQQLRHERDHLIVHGRNLEAKSIRHQSAVSPLESQVAAKSSVEKKI